MTFKVNKTPLIFKTIPFKAQQVKPIVPIVPLTPTKVEIDEALNKAKHPGIDNLFIESTDTGDNLNILNKPYLFITGPAGSGKTYTINKYNAKDPDYIELVATTGIAAINLNSKTVNSRLKYYDTDSLLDNYIDQKLHYYLREIREEKKVLGIEEISMMDARQLDIIFDAINEINEDRNPKKLGLHIIGDLLQLPPVKANMVTEAKCWPYFQENTIRLNKIWRQGNEKFIEAINLVRSGDGRNAVSLLKECGVTFIPNLIDKFDGTTLIPKNDLVDQYNDKRLMEVNSEMITSIPRRKGEQLGEWKTQIPNLMRFKVGAYVMILSNDCPTFSYANGDCGEITAYNKTTDVFTIKLKRNNNEVQIKRRKLLNLTKKQPNLDHFGKDFTPYVDTFTHKWIIGEVEYHPLRLAYASTIHKCLEEGTIVHEMRRGQIKIKNIIKGDRVWNGKNFAYVKNTAQSKQYGFKISFESGEFIICSPKHKFPTANGNEMIFKEAQELQLHDVLYRTNERYYTKVVALQDLKLQFNMIDIELENTNDGLNSLFLANNILTHNSQGLSLDKLQININTWNFGLPGMSYVAISRARTPEGLFIVGTEDALIAKIKTEKSVLEYV